MRKVLSSTAGATFHNETNYMTFCVRKDYIEMIVKVDRGVYIIINIAHVTPELAILAPKVMAWASSSTYPRTHPS